MERFLVDHIVLVLLEYRLNTKKIIKFSYMTPIDLYYYLLSCTISKFAPVVHISF